MSDRINCRNCIHFDDLEHRCCLNDGVLGNERECYFRLSKRTPKGKDVVIEHLKSEIAELKQQLETTEQLRQDVLEEGLTCVERDKQKIEELEDRLHTQPKEIVEKIKAKMENVVDTLINLGNGKEDAVSWFCEILQQILKEYGGE